MGVAGGRLGHGDLPGGSPAWRAWALSGKKVPALHISRDDLRLRGFYLRRLLGMGVPMGVADLHPRPLAASCCRPLSTAWALWRWPLSRRPTSSTSCSAASSTHWASPCPPMGGAEHRRPQGRTHLSRPAGRHGDWQRLLGAGPSPHPLFGRPMMLLFVDSSETVIIGLGSVHGNPGRLFSSPWGRHVIRLLVQGMGYSKLAMFAGVFEMIARGLLGCSWCPGLAFCWPALPAPWPGFWQTPSLFSPIAG